MPFMWIALGVAVFLMAAIIAISYICFRITFFVPNRKVGPVEEIETPEGEIYEVYKEQMEAWIMEARSFNPKKFFIKSFDGLTLCGKYYEFSPDAPVELMFHGYRGNSERDLSGAVQRCFALKRSALIVDQRGSRESEGSVITFGVNEHKDCLAWVDFMVNHFGKGVKIILTGISMGASTVLMAAGKELPDNVVGVMADCGFTSAKEIICKVIRQIGLPPKIVYPFIKLGARLFGKFDLEEFSAIDAAAKINVPTFLIHGENDDFVPCQMSRDILEACKCRKELLTIPDAGHGLAYLVDRDRYFDSVQNFFGM